MIGTGLCCGLLWSSNGWMEDEDEDGGGDGGSDVRPKSQSQLERRMA